MTGEIGFCGGKFYFYFHGAKFWAKLSLSWWHTSLHLPGWRHQGAVPQQMVACYSTIQSLDEQQFYPHIWRGHSTLVLQRKSFICQEKLPESGVALLCHVMVLETWHSAWMTSMKSIQHLNTGFAPWVQGAPVSQQEYEGNGSFLPEMICPKISWLLNSVFAEYPFSATNEEGHCETTVLYTWVNCSVVNLLCAVEYWKCIPTLTGERYLLQ